MSRHFDYDALALLLAHEDREHGAYIPLLRAVASLVVILGSRGSLRVNECRMALQDLMPDLSHRGWQRAYHEAEKQYLVGFVARHRSVSGHRECALLGRGRLWLGVRCDPNRRDPEWEEMRCFTRQMGRDRDEISRSASRVWHHRIMATINARRGANARSA